MVNDFASRLRVGILRTLMFSTISMISIQAHAQSSFDGKSDKTSDDLQQLYECASYYSVVYYCSSRDSSEVSPHISAVAFRNRDKVIHLIYVNSKRAGVLPETSQSSMTESFTRMVTSKDYQCSTLARNTSSLKSMCDMLIKDVPDHLYDKAQKAGMLEKHVPTSIE